MSSGEFIPPSQQKRETARVAVSLPGHYKLKSAKEWMPCEIIDIGTGGLQLRGQFSFYAEDKIDVKYFLEEKTILCQVEVTNISGRKAGGRYLSINDNDLALIQEYIHRSLLS